jgi:hypothetical protein
MVLFVRRVMGLAYNASLNCFNFCLPMCANMCVPLCLYFLIVCLGPSVYPCLLSKLELTREASEEKSMTLFGKDVQEQISRFTFERFLFLQDLSQWSERISWVLIVSIGAKLEYCNQIKSKRKNLASLGGFDKVCNNGA